MTFVLLLLGPLLGALVLQLLLLRLTRTRLSLLRWSLLGLLSIPACGMVYEWRLHSFFWELGVLLWALIALSGLIGWSIAWAVYKRQNKN